MTGFGALELLARAGFFVKGVVYMVVGALACSATPPGDSSRLSLTQPALGTTGAASRSV
jgi:hypothetical protein